MARQPFPLASGACHRAAPIRRVAVFLGVLFACAIGVAGPAGAQDCGLTWQRVPASWPTGALCDVTFGAGRYVAVGSAGTITTSPDGANWGPAVSGTDLDIVGVAFGNGRFVAVTKPRNPELCVVLVSADGLAWESRCLRYGALLNRVRFGGGLFVAVGEAGLALTSADGDSWEEVNTEVEATLTEVVYGDGQWVLLGHGDAVNPGTYSVVSYDGVEWMPFYTYEGSVETVNAVFANGMFYAAMAGGWLRESLTGRTWEWVQEPLPLGTGGIGWSGTLLVIPVEGGFLTSTSGEVWVPLWVPRAKRLVSMTWGDSGFVAVGGVEIFTSPDGLKWTERGARDSQDLVAVASGEGRWLALGSQASSFVCLTSGDGILWEDRSSNGSIFPRVLLYDGSRIIAANYDFPILTSEDGSAWTLHMLPPPIRINGMAYDGTRYVAVGTNELGRETRGVASTSTDGLTWSDPTPMPTSGMEQVIWGNGTFVAAGQGALLWSSDGVSWTDAAPGQYHAVSSFAYGAGRFVAVATFGTILTSPDGRAWTVQNLPERPDLRGVVYGRGRFVAAGASGAVFVSTDAETWTAWPQDNAVHLTSIVAGDAGFMAVGWDGVHGGSYFLASTDGEHWERRAYGTDTLDLRAISVGPRFVGFSGYNPAILMESLDGLNWTETPLGLSAPRSVAYGDAGFVAVGEGGSTYSTRDGEIWSVGMSGTREYLSGVAFGAGLYVAVGFEGSLLTSADGLHWTSRPTPEQYQLYSVTYGGGVFIAIGFQGFYISTDGVRWDGYGGDIRILGPAVCGDTLCLIEAQLPDYTHVYLVSHDRRTWLPYRAPTWLRARSFAYGAGHYAAALEDETLIVSNGGGSWVRADAPVPANTGLGAVGYGPGGFVAVGDDDLILMAPCEEGPPPPVIAKVAKGSSPFRISLSGSNFQPGCQVTINGTAWSNFVRSGDTKIVLKGGAALKALAPKKVVSVFEVINPDGGVAARYWAY